MVAESQQSRVRHALCTSREEVMEGNVVLICIEQLAAGKRFASSLDYICVKWLSKSLATSQTRVGLHRVQTFAR